ncbi:hypothetical protein lerEdw1_001366 [Lerista edwardsae]|nr:hypothetical protein lerEdw1_001366 [Lerista edwardsae]
MENNIMLLQMVLILLHHNYVVAEDGDIRSSCRTAPADLVFILDGSYSVGPENFEIVKRWLVNITSNFDIGPKFIQVGVVQYSDYPVLEIPLGTHDSNENLVGEMESVHYLGGNTRTGRAIQFAIDHLFAKSPRFLTKIAVVLTDGKSQDDVKDVAAEARKNKITLFAIGVGSETEEEELRAIANKPSTTYVFYVEDYIAISRIREIIKQKLCEESVCPTRIPVAARDEKGFDILLGLGVKKKVKKRIQIPSTNAKAYEVTSQIDLNVFPEGLPPSYVFVSTQRFKVRKTWDLWRILSLDGRLQIAVTINGEDRTLSFTTTSIVNNTQVVTFTAPRVKTLFDENWHQIRLLVTEADVTLYIDDQEIEMKPLHPVLGIYISGLTQIGKYSGKEETVQFDLQKLRIYCDPEQNNRETACEIPGFNGEVSKIILVHTDIRETLGDLGIMATLENLVQMVSLKFAVCNFCNLIRNISNSISGLSRNSRNARYSRFPRDSGKFAIPCIPKKGHVVYQACRVNLGEMGQRVNVDFPVSLDYMGCQHLRGTEDLKGIKGYLEFMAKRVQREKRVIEDFRDCQDGLEKLENQVLQDQKEDGETL